MFDEKENVKTKEHANHALFFCFLFIACINPWKLQRVSSSEAIPITEWVRENNPKIAQEIQSKGWEKWIDEYNDQIKERVLKGEEDTLINFLLFGTSFTKKPRITAKQLENLANKKPEDLRVIIGARAKDLIRALLANPHKNERLSFAYQIIVKRKGFNINTLEGRKAVEEYLLNNTARVFAEHANYLKALEVAKGNPAEEFIVRSSLYSQRGLSFDTQLAPNYAIEDALSKIHKQGLLKTIKRVAIIGPGLDFTDKQEGYDIYPLQSIQPFAIIDSLIKLGLSNEKELVVVTFDISDRVNQHLCNAVKNANLGKNYHLWLPLDSNVSWKKEYIDYWKTVGQKIGKPARLPANLGLIPNLKMRMLSLQPRYVKLIIPVELNVVSDRLMLNNEEKFDLIIATNVFVYYDVFEQTIALLNISEMLRPGGFLLSNNAILELPSIPIRSIGYSTTEYSERKADGDHIVWYRRIQ
ncbi:MAG: class I SAM-dependent methyltransferase [Acidobacteria bacterium]|nr:MAG: class I SAM-dependent methyltransferase [Acidobacteriota bacterium]